MKNTYLDHCIDELHSMAENYFLNLKMESMKSKTERILEVANDMITTNGHATTLGVKIQCRNLWPNEYWTQHYVSKVMRTQNTYDWGFRDNGQYREYYSTTTSTMTQSKKGSKTYTFDLDKDFFKIHVSGDLQHVMQTLKVFNIPVRYSESKDEIQYLPDIHNNHLANIVRKMVRETKGTEDLVKALSTVEVVEFSERVESGKIKVDFD